MIKTEEKSNNDNSGKNGKTIFSQGIELWYNIDVQENNYLEE